MLNCNTLKMLWSWKCS